MWWDVSVGGRTFEELRAKGLEPSRASYHSMVSALRRDGNWRAIYTVSLRCWYGFTILHTSDRWIMI